MINICLGVFAHNEEKNIFFTLQNLFLQDIFKSKKFRVSVHILVNGCTDLTIVEAQRAVKLVTVQDCVIIHDIQEKGKSRTWNYFVHDICSSETELIFFMDADIFMPNFQNLSNIAQFVFNNPNIDGSSSLAVKDIVFDRTVARGILDVTLSAAGGTLNNWRDSICGQLYILRASVARGIYLPIGLPVEDGFIRAMIQTHNFSSEGGVENRLDGCETNFHVYKSERSISALIRHQTRIVIGSAINSVIFRRLRMLSFEKRNAEILESARDCHWLKTLLQQELPRAPFGYVPFHFLVKRVIFWWRMPNKLRPRSFIIMIVGFCFDVIVYIKAQYSMWRGAGAGFW